MRKYENVSLNKLKPYKNNARTHSKEQIEKIALSIKEFGFINSVLIDGEYGIIAGHGRVLGAQKLGMEEIPCLFIENLTEEQKRVYILADNKLALDAGWDDKILREEIKALDELNFDISVTGFDLNGFDFNQTEIKFEEDNYNIKGSFAKAPKSKYGDIYKLGKHRLMCGDSTLDKDVKELTNGTIMDLGVTDPPYNVNYGSINDGNYGKKRVNANKILNDNMDNEAFCSFLKNFYAQMMSTLKPGAAFYVFHSDTERYNFEKSLHKVGGHIRQNLIWVKNGLVLGRQDYHWKHELCLYGWKDGAGHYFINDRTQTTVFEDKIDLDKMSKDELKQTVRELMDKRINTTVIHEDKTLRNDIHPTMKPIRLISRLISNSSIKGENVIDFFGGSGSTLISCEQLGRNCYTMERDPKYVDAIIDRWEKLTGKTAIKINEGEKIE